MTDIICSRCSSSLSPRAREETLVGWVLESPGRGTLSLLYTCLFTTFLCTWVVIHPRVYRRRHFGRLHKAALFIKAIFAPEFIAVEGLQEWSQARKVVRDCEQLTEGQLKLVHAFYIGMLALRYRTPRGQRVIWPNQYIWLLEQGLINWKDHPSWGLSEETIRDKSNADSTVKLFALYQVSWFVVQSIVRAVHSLPLAQLETMTLSYIPLFVVTYFFWWVKPKDVITSSVVELPEMLPQQMAVFESMAVSNAFDDESIGNQDSLWNVWYLTPRLFEKEAEDRALQEFKVPQGIKKPFKPGKDVDQGGNTVVGALPVTLEPKEVVVAHWDPELYGSKIWPAICLFGASFGALHLISWNATFPTLVEQWLWRAAAITSIVSMLIFMHFKKVIFRCGGPLTMISLLSPAFYFLSRMIMLGGVVAAFRASDPAVYETYVVSTYWVHLLRGAVKSIYEEHP